MVNGLDQKTLGSRQGTATTLPGPPGEAAWARYTDPAHQVAGERGTTGRATDGPVLTSLAE